MLSRRTRPRASRRASARAASAPGASARWSSQGLTRGGAFAAALLLAGLTAAPARAGLRIVDQGVTVDMATRRAHFEAEFDSPPDLFTRDEFGRLADSFQYEIDADGPDLPEAPVGPVEAVVRGDEIYAANALRVRAAGEGVEPDPDPVAGGWGRVRDSVPFNLDGPNLSFSVPLQALGDDDGVFSYRLFTVEFGLTVDEVDGVVNARPPAPVPLPPAAPAAAATLVAAWGLSRLRARLLGRRG
jgi:hypothetical protein